MLPRVPPLDYVILRLVRHCLPAEAVRFLLQRRLFIRPGMETRAPVDAIRRFTDAMSADGVTVAGRRILIFGYGGRFDVALALLRAGARHVVLVDPYAAPAPDEELALASAAPFIRISDSAAVPDPDWLTVVNAPLERHLAAGGAPADLVLSNSVLEHVEDVAGTVLDLANITAPDGQQYHFIDLRDHFFRYPFEMLCYSEPTWRRFLNPGSNLNRLRTGDFERLFSAHFREVSIQVLHSEVSRFRATRPRIRPEFLTGEEQRDAVTQVLLRASKPVGTKSRSTS